jgi:hypothetical protein
MKPRPLKGLGMGFRTTPSLYLSVVPFETFVCISERLVAHIAFRCQRVRASHSLPLSWLGQRLLGSTKALSNLFALAL